MANNLANIIEKIKIAELDSNKVYFMQICSGSLNIEAFQQFRRLISRELTANNIPNIIVITPDDVEIKFTELRDKND